MRKLTYGYMVSVDGFIEGPNRELEWPVLDEELLRHANEQESRFDAFLYGRRMYEVMRYWDAPDPSLPDYELEYARIWQRTPKIVFSRTLDRVGENARLVRDNAIEEVKRLKAQQGGDLVLGGAGLAASLVPLGLVDEYQLYVQPVVLGSGTRMFPPLDDRMNLRLAETLTLRSGVVFLRYERED
jgi:dihydrofolate reductase